MGSVHLSTEQGQSENQKGSLEKGEPQATNPHNYNMNTLTKVLIMPAVIVGSATLLHITGANKGLDAVDTSLQSHASRANMTALAERERDPAYQAERAEYIKRARFIYGNLSPNQLETLGGALDN